MDLPSKALDQLLRVPCLPPLLFAVSPHKASRPAISSVSGCLGRPAHDLESGTEEGVPEQETPENATGSGDQLAKVVPTPSLGTPLPLN